MKKIFHLIVLLILLPAVVYAQANFIIKRIQINGLQGISRNTVMNYLPVRVGDQFDVNTSSQIIQSLFKTGFFSDIQVAHSNGTLIINVEQRPIISQITITGNKLIPTKKLHEALNKAGFSVGTIFDNSLLTKIKTSLITEYFTVGKYNARVKVNVQAEKRNRVAIKITISEGKTAKIHSIAIVGNHAFSEKTLLRQFKLTPTTAISSLLSFFTHNDQYSAEKLAADLESLRSYYMDRGYIKFKILSSQVSITPDRKQVYITIYIQENYKYRISGYSISGKTILPKQKIAQLITLKKGEFFSLQKITAINHSIGQALGTKGYANANIQAIPQFNEQNHTVFLKFTITPGIRIYVRRITFSGNNRTNDEVYRRELIQMEGALLSPQNIKESKRNLLNLPFVKNAEMSTTPVPNKADQVDINYKMSENSAATLRGGVSYSQLDKFGVNGAISQKNLFGTGNSLDLSLYYSRPVVSLNFNYFNPYYSTSRIGRSINVYANRFDANRLNLTDFATNTYGFAIGYVLPVTAHSFFSAGYGFEHDHINLDSDPSRELSNFKNKYGSNFYQIQTNAGWSYSKFDRYLFPTQGLKTGIGVTAAVPVSHKSLEYYKISANAVYYQPLYKQFISKLRGNIGYGNGYGKFNGELPYFKNYYAGGIGSVRGYEGNSLGPKDSKGNTIGGNFEIEGSASLIFPNPLHDSVRTSLFVDGGNVYHNIHIKDLRFSTGIEVDWRSPVGVINFSLAKALNARKEDDTQPFQFTIGTTL